MGITYVLNREEVAVHP